MAIKPDSLDSNPDEDIIALEELEADASTDDQKAEALGELVKKMAKLAKKAESSKEEDKEALAEAYENLKRAFKDVSGRNYAGEQRELDKEAARLVKDSLKAELGKDSFVGTEKEAVKVLAEKVKQEKYVETIRDLWNSPSSAEDREKFLKKYEDKDEAEQQSLAKRAFTNHLEKRRIKIESALAGDGIVLDRDVYYSLIRKGYRPDEIKVGKANITIKEVGGMGQEEIRKMPKEGSGKKGEGGAKNWFDQLKRIEDKAAVGEAKGRLRGEVDDMWNAGASKPERLEAGRAKFKERRNEKAREMVKIAAMQQWVDKAKARLQDETFEDVDDDYLYKNFDKIKFDKKATPEDKQAIKSFLENKVLYGEDAYESLETPEGPLEYLDLETLGGPLDEGNNEEVVSTPTEEPNIPTEEPKKPGLFARAFSGIKNLWARGQKSEQPKADISPVVTEDEVTTRNEFDEEEKKWVKRMPGDEQGKRYHEFSDKQMPKKGEGKDMKASDYITDEMIESGQFPEEWTDQNYEDALRDLDEDYEVADLENRHDDILEIFNKMRVVGEALNKRREPVEVAPETAQSDSHLEEVEAADAESGEEETGEDLPALKNRILAVLDQIEKINIPDDSINGVWNNEYSKAFKTIEEITGLELSNKDKTCLYYYSDLFKWIYYKVNSLPSFMTFKDITDIKINFAEKK